MTRKRTNDNDLSPFTRLGLYGEHKRAVSAVAVAPGNSTTGQNGPYPLVASASADGTVKLWDLNNANYRSNSNNNNNNNNNGTLVPSSSPTTTPSETTTSVRHKKPHHTNNHNNSTELVPKSTLMGHSRGINDVTWSKSCHYIATASDDKTLRLWDVTTGEALVEFRGHLNFVFCTKFNASGNLLVSGGFDETVKLWDVRTGDCVSTLPAHSDPVTGVDFNRDGTCVVSGSHDGLIRIWDTATGECLKTIYAHGNPPVGHVQYSPNGKYVLAGTLDSKLRLWHMTSKEPTAKTTNTTNTHFLPSSGGGGKCTRIYASSQHHVNTKYCVASDFVVSHPNRQRIVTGSERGCLVLYDLNSTSTTILEKGHVDAVLAVASHDASEFMASGGMTLDKTVQFWTPQQEQQETIGKKAKSKE